MRIGIAVVYLVSERNEQLLDLHLRQIERCTDAPYTIYACVNSLLPRFREKLENSPCVKICECETYPQGAGLWRQDRALAARKGLAYAGSKYEHSWYLEQLIGTAIDDGVSHIGTFHVDSFPVRSGWDTELISKFSDRCVLAAVTRDTKSDQKPLTAGILFPREFYLKYHPRLLLSQEEVDSADYQRYREASPHTPDSGVGYGFRIFMEGLTWYPLAQSNLGGNHVQFASVYGDLIFHLVGAVIVERQQRVGFTLRPSERGGLIGKTARVARLLFPEVVKRNIRRCVSPHIEARCQSTDREAWEQERRRLFEDPDRYLMYLRTGVEHPAQGISSLLRPPPP
jgi:hypothetical protein